MGQRLLLAITLLIIARTVTFISPLPAEPEAVQPPREQVARSPAASPSAPPLQDSFPDSPPFEAAPEEFDLGENESDWRATQPSWSNDSPMQDDRNPVWNWEREQAAIPNQAGSPDWNPASTSIAAVCENIKSAVVTVHAGREIGSGSIVQSNGLVITNHHVVRRLRDQPLSVQLQDGSRYGGQVVATDRRNDLALIQLETAAALPTVPIAAVETPNLGQAVCAIGSPFGQSGVVTAGQVVQILPNGDLQSDVELQPGNSGGPLINARGEMVGVNKGVARSRRGGSREAAIGDEGQRFRSSQRLSFATSAAVAAQFIQQNQGASPQWRNGNL